MPVACGSQSPQEWPREPESVSEKHSFPPCNNLSHFRTPSAGAFLPPSATLVTREISCAQNALFRSARCKVGQLSDRFGSEKQLVGRSYGILENASFRLEAQERKGKQSGFRRPVEQARLRGGIQKRAKRGRLSRFQS